MRAQLARSWGVDSIALHCDSSDPAMFQMYQKCGPPLACACTRTPYRCMLQSPGPRWPQAEIKAGTIQPSSVRAWAADLSAAGSLSGVWRGSRFGYEQVRGDEGMPWWQQQLLGVRLVLMAKQMAELGRASGSSLAGAPARADPGVVCS